MFLKHYFNFHYLWKMLTVFTDGILIFLGFIVAYWVRLYHDPTSFLKILLVPPLNFSWQDYLDLIIPITLVWLMIFFLTGLYHLEKTKEFTHESYLLFSAINTGVLVYIILTFFRGEQFFSRLILVYAWVMSFVFVWLGRLVLRHVRKRLQRYGYGIKRILVIGMDSVAEQLLEGFRQKNIWNYEIVGILSTMPSAKKELCGFPIIGTLETFQQIMMDNAIEEVILTLSSLAPQKVLQIVNYCKDNNIRFTFTPDMLGLLSSYHTTDMINGIPLITLRKTPLQGYNKWLKRLFDIVVSLSMVVLFSPIMIIVAFLVKLSSEGPVLIFQERMGLDGKTFHTMKFRSMYHDAEQQGRFWTIKNDPRITPIGKWLRRYNLDELPQFFNVIKGDMSLVGPRPEQPRFVEEFKQHIPRYMDRYKIKAGITGWAQVNGWRGDTSIEERVRYDIYYIENWSLWFDIYILFRTLFSMGS